MTEIDIKAQLDKALEYGLKVREGIKTEEIIQYSRRYLRRASTDTKLSKQEVLRLIEKSIEQELRLYQLAIFELSEELEQEQEEQRPVHEKEYRYKVSQVVEIYNKFSEKTISKMSINQDTIIDKGGYVKLHCEVYVEGEVKSAIESEVISYLSQYRKLKVMPEKIREFCYYAPKK
jgi:hypothetical protein